MLVDVAMIEPMYPINVGHVARLMKNFGVRRLYFVNPQVDRLEAVKYSTHGKGVLAAARTTSLKQLRRKFDVLIGTTAIRAKSRLNVLRDAVDAEQMAQIIYDGHGKQYCILLGREASGLNNAELAICDLVVTVNTKTKYKTMNIAHVLAILLYEISKLKHDPPGKKSRKTIDLASQHEIDLLLRYLGQVVEASNYDMHKKPLLEAAFKKILAKSVPTAKEAMLLVSLFRRSVLAIERKDRTENR